MKDIIYVTRSRKSKNADNTMVKEKYKKHKQGSTNIVHKTRRCTWVLWKSNLPLRPYSKHPISLFVLFVVCGAGGRLVKIIYELCFYELLLCPLRFQHDKMYSVLHSCLHCFILFREIWYKELMNASLTMPNGYSKKTLLKSN